MPRILPLAGGKSSSGNLSWLQPEDESPHTGHPSAAAQEINLWACETWKTFNAVSSRESLASFFLLPLQGTSSELRHDFQTHLVRPHQKLFSAPSKLLCLSAIKRATMPAGTCVRLIFICHGSHLKREESRNPQAWNVLENLFSDSEPWKVFLLLFRRQGSVWYL